MAIKMLSEYGPVVFCPNTGDYESTHRPTGSSDPWFCMACGGTNHEPLPETMTPYRPGDHCRILSTGKSPACSIGTATSTPMVRSQTRTREK